MTEPPPGPLAGPQEIMEMLGGISRSRFRAIMLDPRFPRPFQTLAVGSVWLRADVERYIREHRPWQLAPDDDEL